MLLECEGRIFRGTAHVGAGGCLSWDDPEIQRSCRGFGPGGRVELSEQSGDVVINGAAGKRQPRGNFDIPKPLAEELENIDLARGQAGWVTARCGAGTPGDAGYSQVSEPAGGVPGLGAGAKPLETAQGFANVFHIRRIRE